jgi:hypothetical protein
VLECDCKQLGLQSIARERTIAKPLHGLTPVPRVRSQKRLFITASSAHAFDPGLRLFFQTQKDRAGLPPEVGARKRNESGASQSSKVGRKKRGPNLMKWDGSCESRAGP